jgi:hypothetical protein
MASMTTPAAAASENPVLQPAQALEAMSILLLTPRVIHVLHAAGAFRRVGRNLENLAGLHLSRSIQRGYRVSDPKPMIDACGEVADSLRAMLAGTKLMLQPNDRAGMVIHMAIEAACDIAQSAAHTSPDDPSFQTPPDTGDLDAFRAAERVINLVRSYDRLRSRVELFRAAA